MPAQSTGSHEREEPPVPYAALTLGEIASMLFACGVVFWRMQVHPDRLWRDWMVVVAAHWIAIVLITAPTVKRLSTPLVMLYLLVLFALGNLPPVWTSYGWWP